MTDTHVSEPIDTQKELQGNSRKGGDAPPEVQQKIIDLIIEEARKSNFDNRDIAYYIAIAKRESGFNPDAANPNSTASGIAQVTDKTALAYGVNDSNRFDARSSIKAGLAYFGALKDRLKKDYGSTSGEYEPLIYLLYHYGAFVHYKDRIRARDPIPIYGLKNSARYADSKTIVDDAAHIEKILNEAHALKIRLTDIMGQPMTSRKVIVVRKTIKPQIDIGATASLNSNDNSTPASGPAPSAQPANTGAPSSHSCDSTPEFPVEWESVAYEISTDETGGIPEIQSATLEPFWILIPRVDYEAYNEAVRKQLICEYGNEHDVLPRDEEHIVPPLSKQQPQRSVPPQLFQKAAQKEALLKSENSSMIKAAKQTANEKSAPSPGITSEITFNDVVIALRNHLGWEQVYKTAFVYIKQFYTRPRLPDAPLSNENPTAKGKTREQVISSSLNNQERNTTKTKDKVTTAEETAKETVNATTIPPWMVLAIQEQSKSGAEKVVEKAKSQRGDTQWKEKYKIRTEAEREIKIAQDDLKREARKPEKSRDTKKIGVYQQKVKEQEAIRDQADQDMQEIEKKYSNQDIVKYLQSTSLSRDAARDDSTAWCASFANWCVENAGYHGTGSAAADSWINWGEKIEKPKYGAITITTRSINPVKYHVGFFVGIGHKNILDGEEETEVTGKNGEKVKQKRKKMRKVETVRLLSGNYSNQIKEASDWTVNHEDDPVLHLVSYRWPTPKEKK